MALPSVKIKFEVDPTAAKKGLSDIQKAIVSTDAATKKYEKDLGALKRAQVTGLITMKQFDKEVKRIGGDFDRTARSASRLTGATAQIAGPTKAATFSFKNLANASGRTRSQLQNVSFQLQDIIVQIQGGQGVVRALSQQLPQLAGGFGAVGAAVGVVAGLGIPALAVAFKALGISSQSLDESLEAVEDALSDTDDIAKILTGDMEALGNMFGSVTASTKELAAVRAEVALRDLSDAAQEMNKSLTSLFDGNAWLNIGQAEQLGQALGLGTEASGLFKQAMQELSETESLDEQLERVQGMRRAFVMAVGPISDMTEAQFEFFTQLVNTETTMGLLIQRTEELLNPIKAIPEEIIKAREAAEALGSTYDFIDVKFHSTLDAAVAISKEVIAARKAAEVAGSTYDEMAIDFERAADNAGRLPAQIKRAHKEFLAEVDALAKVDELLGLNEDKLIRLPDEIKLAAIKMLEFQLATADAGFQVQLILEKIQAIKDTMVGVTEGVPLFLQGFTPEGLVPTDEEISGKTGGGGRDKVDPAEAKLEALIESLQTERETVELFREEGLALLASASETELAALGGINEAKLRLEEEYQERLRGIKVKTDRSNLAMTLSAGTQLLGALGQFNDKALKLSKVFGIAEALVSTYKGAAKALELPFPANLFAMATVIATGLSQVAAIRGVSKGGGGGGGASAAAVSAPAVAAAAPAAAGPAQAPLNVRLSGLGINDFISGGQLSSLFDSLQDEAGDRGLNVSFAT